MILIIKFHSVTCVSFYRWKDAINKNYTRQIYWIASWHRKKECSSIYVMKNRNTSLSPFQGATRTGRLPMYNITLSKNEENFFDFFCRTLPHTTMRKMIANFSFCSVKFFFYYSTIFFLPNKAQNFLHLFFLLRSSSLSHTPTISINIFFVYHKKMWI